MFDTMDEDDNDAPGFNDYEDQNRNLDDEALLDDGERQQLDEFQENYFAHKKFKHRHRSESFDKPLRQPFQIELENDGVYISPGGHKHKHRHKKFRRYDVGDEISPSSENARRSLDVETSPDSCGTSRQVSRDDDGFHDAPGLEDGELEDGELDDDDGETHKEKSRDKKHKNHGNHSSRHLEKSPPKDVQEPVREMETEEVQEFKEDILPSVNNKKERKKARRGHRVAKKKNKEEKKKKAKRHQYVDYDMVEEKEEGWTEPKKSRSPPATYDSPYESPYTSPHRPFSSPHHRNSPRRDRSPSGGYGSPYHSPPGLYDSPSDESGEETTATKNVKNNEVQVPVPVPVQVPIQPDHPQQTFGKKRGRDRSGGMKRKNKDNDSRREPVRKRPLLADMPMHERPHCKYFMEGKCSKGNECPFNHDFKPPGKLEVCKFYINDTCVKGSRCTYMHSDYPCKYFHTGQTCYQGDSCKFSHEPLNEETALIVEKMKENRDYPTDNATRPSLLGSPPRKPVKKIPSIFDIEVFPPNQHPSPRKPAVSPARPSGFYSDLGSQNGPHDGQGPHFQGHGPGQNDGPPRFLGGGDGPPRFSGPGGSDTEGQHMQGPGNEGHRFQNSGDSNRYNGPCPGPGSDGPRFNGPGSNVQQRQSGPGDGPLRFNGPASEGTSRFNAPDIPPRYNGPGPEGLHFQNAGDGPPRFGSRGPGTNIAPGFGPGSRFGPGPGFNQGPGPNFGPPRGPNFGMQRGPGPLGFSNPAAPVLNMLGAILSHAPPELIQSALAPRLINPGKEPLNDNAEGRGPQASKCLPDYNLEHRVPVSQTPPHSMEANLEPRDVKLEPRDIKPEPREIKSEYQEKLEPREIKQAPQDSKFGPQETKHEPRDIKQEPHDPKESLHQDPRGKKTPPHKNSEDSEIDAAVPSEEKKMANESNVSGNDEPSLQEHEEDGFDAAGVALMHLPPMQRELFMRIHQQQQRDSANENKGDTAETGDEAIDKEKDDDDWYSSDEEGGAPRLTDVLKNLNKQPVQTPDSPQPGKMATGSTFNIMQMIQSIKNQATTSDSTNSAPGSQPSAKDSRDPRQRGSRTDPRRAQAQKKGPNAPVFPPSGQFPEFRLPPLHVDPPVTPAVMLSMVYRIHTAEVNPQKPYYSIPSNVDPWHAQFKSDPRVLKYIARTGGKKPVSKNQSNGESDPVPVQKSLDPRRARHSSVDEKEKLSANSVMQKSKDPRLRKPDSGEDVRVPAINTDLPPSLLQRTTSEQFLFSNPPNSRMGDPRLQRVQSIPPQNVQSSSMDPRRARQQNQNQVPVPTIRPPNPLMFNRQLSMDGGPLPNLPPIPPMSGGLPLMKFPRFPNNPRVMEPPFNDISVHGGPWSPDVTGPMEKRMTDLRSDKDSRSMNDPRFDNNVKMLPMGGMSSGQNMSADPRSARKPPGLTQMADPRVSQNTDTVSDSSNTIDSAQGSKESQANEQKAKFDHRNNPKFKRKPASSDSSEKRFTGQRKSSMEYSSPLGMNEGSTDSGSSYNSYNKPPANPVRWPKQSDTENSGGTVPGTDKLGAGGEQNVPMEQSDGAFNLPNMMAPPPVVSPPVLQEPPLKDLFKSIDPTASPFC